MRIIGGQFRGRTLEAPRSRVTRPTGARTREAVFNVLVNGKPGVDIEGIGVLDAFAGTGALGFEALSRGAANAVFLDRAPEALALIRRNAGNLGVAERCVMLRLDAARLGKPPRAATPAGLAFLDPPYGDSLTEPALRGLARFGWIEPGAVCVCETEAGYDLVPGQGYETVETRDYGAARISFLRYAG